MPAPLLAAVLRGLTAARGAVAAAGEVRGVVGAMRAGAPAAAAAAGAMRAGAPAAAAAAKPPAIDYGRLMASMGNPNAKRDAEDEAAQRQASENAQQREQEARRRLIDSLKAAATGGLGVVTAFTAIPKAVKAWTDSLVESRRDLARFNPRIAGAMAALDAQRLRNQFRLGGATAGTTEQLAKAIGEFREAMLPLETIARNGINVLATGITKVATGVAHAVTAVLLIAKAIPGLAGAAKAIEDALKKNDGKLPAQQLMDAFKKADIRPGERAPLQPLP